MKLKAFNTFCGGLPHTTSVIQWGEATVCSFKVSEMSFDILKEQPGCRGAPHLASRGMKWIQRYNADTLSDDDLKAYLEGSYQLVAAGLTKKLQRELGFLKDGK